MKHHSPGPGVLLFLGLVIALFQSCPLPTGPEEPEQVAAPLITPVAGAYLSPVEVSISSSTPGSSIFYTLDGSSPTTSSIEYTGPITLTTTDSPVMLTAFAIKESMSDSEPVVAAYVIENDTVAEPTFSPQGGTYDQDQQVTIECATTGVTIHYTTDGTMPTSLSPVYGSPIGVSGDGTSMTISAIGVCPGMDDSVVHVESYLISYAQVSTPAFSPPGGTYSEDQEVTITCVTGGATIHYTTDGTTPTAASPVYGSPVVVAGDGTEMTIGAIAVCDGMLNSETRSESYTISYGQVSMPYFIPAGGTYSEDQEVIMGCVTGGATIHYTTDDTMPTAASPVYESPIEVSGHRTSVTINAIALRDGMLDSEVRSEEYEIGYRPITPAGLTAVPTANGVVLSWSPSEYAESYVASRSAQGPDSGFEVLYEGGDLTCIDNLPHGTFTYWYRVRPGNVYGSGIWTDAVSADPFPSTPTSLDAAYIGSQSATLYWASSDIATGYLLYRSLDTDPLDWTVVYDGPDSSWSDAGLEPGTHYVYRVSAINDSGESDLSDSCVVLTRPSMPTLISAASTLDSTILVEWSPSTAADEYELQRYIPSTETLEVIYAGENVEHLDTDVVVDLTSHYRVRAVNVSGPSDYTDYVVAGLVPAQPAAPVITDPSYDRLTVTWAATLGSSWGELQVLPEGDAEWTHVTLLIQDSYTHSGLDPGWHYSYRIRAVNGWGESNWSEVATGLTTPAVPEAPAPSYSVAGVVQLDWPEVPGADSYSLYRSDSSGGTYVEVYSGVGTTHVDTVLSVNRYYYYRVTAANDSGETWSPVAAIYLYGDPIAPDNVRITAETDSALSVAWSAPGGNPTYNVYRSDSAVGGYTVVATSVATTSYLDDGLDEGTTYFYRVSAVTPIGESPLSDFTAGTTSTSERLGYFKVANSWGEGYWENVADGFYRITYDAMEANSVVAFIYENRIEYEPEYLAVIEVEHPQRAGCVLYVGVGDPGSPIAEKAVNDYSYGTGGAVAFPDNAIAIDVSEFSEYIGTEDLFLRVEDTPEDGAGGTLEVFALEYHSDYSFDLPDPDIAVASADTPLTIPDGATVSLTIPTTAFAGAGAAGAAASSSASASFGVASLAQTRPITAGELQELRSTTGVAVPGEDYNPIIRGFGTGLRPPTEEEWAMIAENGLMLTGAAGSAADGFDQAIPSVIDWSATEHFPPIGNQGSEGSCVSYSVAYYVKTFQEAYENGSDVASASWISGGPSDHQDEIHSPDFVYHQLNNGQNVGTSYVANMEVVSNAGCATWSEMPSSATDHTSWPSETAWRQASLARSEMITSSAQWGTVYYLIVEEDADIDILRTLVANGYLVSISIDANQYSNLTADDIWNTENYTNPDTNHANTIVGYEDVSSY
jgi:fibronectin type 3 domain-containing protein